VFLGPWTPESVGDYCSGTNHVLPTYGYARAYSGLSVTDFQRRMTLQELSPEGLRRLAPTVTTLAGLEGLDAHASAVTRRLANTGGATATTRNDATGTTPSNRAAQSDSPLRSNTAPPAAPDTRPDGVRRLARPEISGLHPYAAARQQPGSVRLNANEAAVPLTPGAALNRYPEIRPARLQERLAAHYGVTPGNLLVTRGSSEAVDLLIRGFCRAGRDSIVISPPTFGMYRVYADIQGARTISVPLSAERDFCLDADAVLRRCTDDTKLIFVCSPNNPTGSTVPLDVIRAIAGARASRSLIVVDEAYAEFSAEPSAVPDVEHRDNLVVLRTLSKALSLAGARCGAVIGAADVISMLNAILAPYALATPVVNSVLEALSLDNLRRAAKAVAVTVRERERMRRALAESPEVLKVWPSEANFLLVRLSDMAAMRSRLARERILVRELEGDAALEGCVRITVGTRRENDLLLAALARTGEADR
jgi:histidinol-phosphate aminotransferase